MNIMTLILFDIDGTLVPSGEILQDINMIEVLRKLSLKHNITLGLVGGGSLDKIRFQMGLSIKYFKYIFAECGSVSLVSLETKTIPYLEGYNISPIDDGIILEKNMLDHCNRNSLNNIIKKALRCIADMPILYHGNQIDFRKGLVYISPPGMQATKIERHIFLEKDAELLLRKKLLDDLKSLDINDEFEMYFGGSVGIAIHPKGWNKSQVINILRDLNVEDKLVYFGDRTEPNGNDYPIYSHPMVEGHSVRDYFDTIDKLIKIYLNT